MKNSAFNHAIGVLPRWLQQTLLVMRITTLILLAALLQVSASSLAQKISIDKKNASIQTILNEISKQSGYDFFYDANALKKIKPISVSIKNTDLNDAIRTSLQGLPLSYSIENKTVVIKEAAPSLLDRLSTVKAILKNIDVKGKVVDQDGKPLPNASIRVKGKNTVTNTNSEGQFELKSVDEDAVLLVSYIGYKTLEIDLKDAVMPLEIKLNVTTGELEEVKVVYNTGYQELNKERATGSFVQLTNDDINRSVSTNILDRILNQTNSLRKEVVGVGTNSYSIRGLSTINANQKPLIVVDGFPYDEGNGRVAVEVIVNNLNPNDIESITVLRDAAAASIWGARSANGVIVITTKKGKYNEQAQIDLNSSLNIISKPALFKANIMSSADVIDYQKKLFATGYYDLHNGPFNSFYSYPALPAAVEIMLAEKKGTISQTDAERQLAQLAGYDVRNDINKYLLRTATNQQYNLNVRGGSDKMSYYGSVGYDKNNSTRKGDIYDRLTLRADNTYRPIRNLELNTYISYTQSKSKDNGIDYNTFLADGGKVAAPYNVLADANGNALHVAQGDGSGRRITYIDTISTKGLLDWHYRPLDEIKNGDNVTNIFNVRFGGGLKYTIIQGLNAEFRGQVEKGLTRGNNYQSTKTYAARSVINGFMFLNAAGVPQYPVPNGGILTSLEQNANNWNIRGTINLNKSWGIHGLSAIIGFDVNESSYKLNQSSKYGFDPEKLTYATNMDFKTVYTLRPSGFTAPVNDNSFLDGRLNRFLSYYGNVAYSINSKYTLSGSARIDASNFFGIKANLRYVPLWSVGASWNLLKEKFLNIKDLSILKLRLTYGYNGNIDNAATSLPVISYSNGSIIYNSSQQFAQLLSNPPNPGLTWERVGLVNIGLDFGLINNRINGTIDAYQKNAKDLIGPLILDNTTGFTQYSANYASIRVHGIDVNLNALVINKGLKLNTSLSLSWNTDKVTDYQNTEAQLRNGNSFVNGGVIGIGKPRYRIYSYKWGGLDPTNGDPIGVVNGENVPFEYALGNTVSVPNTKPEDLVYNGRAMAPFFGNMINTISYKDLSLSFNLVYKFGYYFRRKSINYNQIETNWGGHGDYELRWKNPGDELITNIPSMPVVNDQRYEFYSKSEVLVEKGDLIRLQDIKLAFDVDKTSFKKLPFKTASLFFYVNNVGLLWSANKYGIDPDVVNNNNIAVPRTWAIGLNFKL